MLRMFLGKPGGGKSSGALKDVVEELVFGTRNVCTNLSIDAGALNAFIQKRYPAANVDLHARLRILTEAESKRFWLYRGPGVEVPDVSKEDEKAGRFPDFSAYAGPGVLFVIDEAHIMFDARAWMESGQSLTYYNSQHRKLNDELIFITQFLELIDKRVRGFAQEFWYFRYGAHEKVLTLFKMPSYFLVKVYQRPPTGQFDHPSEVHRYALDKEMAACYDTSAGVGIKGRKAPEHKTKKGLPIWLLVVPVAAVLALLYKGPDWLAAGILGTNTGGRIGKTIGIAEGQQSEATSQATSQAQATQAAQSASRSVDAAPSAFLEGGSPPRGGGRGEGLPPAPVEVIGFAVGRGRAHVELSDGRRFTEKDLQEQGGVLYSRYLELDGKRYHVRRRTPPPPAAASPFLLPAAAPAAVPARVDSSAAAATHAAAASPRDEGSWRLDPDGVRRLKSVEGLGLK